MNKTLSTTNVSQTEFIATKIGKNLRGGEVIELISDVGGGKTTFVKSLSKGAGSKDHVSSPTFTVTNIYNAPHFDIYHFDFYRLPQADLISHELHENIRDDRDVVVVEWANIVEHVLPKERLQIFIKSTGDDSRQLEIKAPDSLNYIIEDVDTKH